MAKLIAVDNFGRNNVDDRLICENMPQTWAECVANHKNRRLDQWAQHYYKVVPDDYVLHVFEP